jgi:hypothetical protein
LQIGLDLAASDGGETTRRKRPSRAPAAQRPIVTDVHRQAETTFLVVADLLRRVPDAGADVWRHAGIEFNLYALGGSGVYSSELANTSSPTGCLAA